MIHNVHMFVCVCVLCEYVCVSVFMGLLGYLSSILFSLLSL